MQRPVVVLTMGRSGSSLVAGLLALHGLWTGRCRPPDRHNPRGYFENLAIGRAIGRLYPGSIYRDLRPMPVVPGWDARLARILAREGYPGGPWLVKANTFTWPIWGPATFVLVWRDVLSTALSACRHDPVYDLKGWRRIVRAHQAEQARVREVHGGLDVETPRLLAGDYGQVRDVIEHLGLTFDRAAAEAFIDRSLWHGRVG